MEAPQPTAGVRGAALLPPRRAAPGGEPRRLLQVAVSGCVVDRDKYGCMSWFDDDDGGGGDDDDDD